MNKLDTSTRTLILGLLVEGNSVRATARIADVSKNTVIKLLEDAGKACAVYHDEYVRGVKASHVQAKEIWSFCFAREHNVAQAKAAPADAGEIWTWTAMDRNSKLMISYAVGDRSQAAAREFLFDLAERLDGRVQLTTDGHCGYLKGVADAFAGYVDYAMLIQQYGDSTRNKTPERRFPRLTHAFSKKSENHACAVALHLMHYNFCRTHKLLRMTPAMAAGVSDHLWDVDDLVALVEKAEAGPTSKKRGPNKKRE